jgi:cellulose synthase/poly-beta-1,6-N-acetylglucosamine synthase-like glycosyltransferase
MLLIYLALIALSLILSAQAAYSLHLMLYTWNTPEAGLLAEAPKAWIKPQTSFTAILPARHEEQVIETTIERAALTNYPNGLVQVLVVLSADDLGTIERANAAVNRLERQGRTDVEVVIFEDGPINKPHGLNVALKYATNDVVCIFDAEDDIHPDIFNIVNTVMVEDGATVVQCGVQLMDYDSNWWSALNVLEYFLWFKSRLHYHAKFGATPLGGNTVFFTRELMARLGGWSEDNLTEDAEIGLRVSAMGENIRIIYDSKYVTREETPPTIGHFIRQRTRWCQGFMQTLQKGDWKKMPTRRQRLLAWYTLAFPNVQVFLGLYMPIAFLSAFVWSVPAPVAMISWLPVMMLGAHFLTQVAALYEFTSDHGLKANWRMVAKMALAWFPYQILLSISAIRAFLRQRRGKNNWESTLHTGQHRQIEDARVI